MIQLSDIDRSMDDIRISSAADSSSKAEGEEPHFMKMLKAAVGNDSSQEYAAEEPQKERLASSQEGGENIEQISRHSGNKAELKGKATDKKGEAAEKSSVARSLNPEALDTILKGLIKNGAIGLEDRRLIADALQKQNVNDGRLRGLVLLLKRTAKAADKKEPALAKLLTEQASNLEEAAKAGAEKSLRSGKAQKAEKGMAPFSMLRFSDTEKNESERPVFRAAEYESGSAQKSAVDWRALGLGTAEVQQTKASSAASDAGRMLQNQSAKLQEQLQSLVDSARFYVRDGKNAAVSLNLHPKSLGTVTLNLGLEQGVLNGRFFVDSPEVKEMLYINLESVRQRLEDAGISVGEFQVNVRGEGRRYSDEEAEASHVFPSASAADEQGKAAGAYESNLMSLHNGSVNLVA